MSDVTSAIESSRVTEGDIKKAISDAIASYTGGNKTTSSKTIKNDDTLRNPLTDSGVKVPTTETDKRRDLLNQLGQDTYHTDDTKAPESYHTITPDDLQKGQSHYFSGLKLFSTGGAVIPMEDYLTYIDTVDNYGSKTRWYYGRDNKSFFYNRGGIFYKHDNPPFEISKKYRDFYSSYDTGGYTGDWSGSTGEYKNGRWSLLHPKELVLNKDDTKNFLTAIEGVRSMSDIISMLDSYSKARYSMITDNIKSPSINTTNTDNSSAVTQNIAINADFSGLHDAQELESAIDNLSNKALQYAYKTI